MPDSANPSPMRMVTVRMREADIAKIDQRAHAAGMTRTEYLKLAGLGLLPDHPLGAVRAHRADPARHACPRCGGLTVQATKGYRQCTVGGCTWAGPVP